VELRQNMRRVSTRPFVWLMTFLAVLALGLTTWYVVVSGPSSHPGVVTTSGFPGPDASDRNQQLQQSQDKNPEVTHGH
jgi:hypothetical protein